MLQYCYYSVTVKQVYKILNDLVFEWLRQNKCMATPNRSLSDFSDASVVSLGRSTHADLEGFSETTPILGISVQNSQAERRQGDRKIAVYSVYKWNNYILLIFDV